MMNRDEVKKVLMVIQAAYPNYRVEDATVTVNVWLKFLEEYSYRDVDMAVQMYISNDTDGFAPSIGQVKNYLFKLQNPIEDNGMEAWSQVLKAIKNGIYHSVEEYEALSPLAKRAIGSPEQIRSMALDENFNEDVARSNFLKAYAAAQEYEKQLASYPKEVREVIEGTMRALEDRMEK